MPRRGGRDCYPGCSVAQGVVGRGSGEPVQEPEPMVGPRLPDAGRFTEWARSSGSQTSQSQDTLKPLLPASGCFSGAGGAILARA
jgi:hypothetical protein